MIPMVLGSMGMKRIIGTGGESLWLSSGTGSDHAGSVFDRSLFMTTALLEGAGTTFAVRPVFTRDGQLDAFLLHEHPDAERSPGQSASSGNGLLSMIIWCH